MIVVADTTPLHYLVLIDAVGILFDLFGSVVIPQAVMDELQHARTPEPVKLWLAAAPPWLEVKRVAVPPDSALAALGAGEQEAIALARELGADLLLMDDKAGRQEAAHPVVGPPAQF